MSPNGPDATAVSVQAADKYYGPAGNRVRALRDIHLEVPAGRFVSVIGPSGCGKSTLLRLMAGLEVADHGTVSVFGHTPRQATAQKRIGLVPQQPGLLPWLTVERNVALPQRLNPRARKRSGDPLPDPATLLDQVGLLADRHKYPHQLSGGMQQRTAIARAFGLRPELLLLDEPFSALDEFTREGLQTQLLGIWERFRTTVIFVTHSVAEAVLLSDTVMVMAPGRISSHVDIDLPRPRGRELLQAPAFHHHSDLLRDRLQAARSSASEAPDRQ